MATRPRWAWTNRRCVTLHSSGMKVWSVTVTTCSIFAIACSVPASRAWLGPWSWQLLAKPALVVERRACHQAIDQVVEETGLDTEHEALAQEINWIKSGKKQPASTMWALYCIKFGDRIMDPTLHNKEFLLRFLIWWRAEWALPQTIKRVQEARQDLAVDEQWRHYVQERGISVGDPRHLPDTFVRQFLFELESGQLPQVTLVSNSTLEELVALVAMRRDVAQKWKEYCEVEYRDFNFQAHTEQSVQRFLAAPQVAMSRRVPTPDLILDAQDRWSSDPMAFPQWLEYCGSRTLGETSVVKLPAEFVQAYLEELENGTLPPVEMASAKQVAELQDLFQRSEFHRRRWNALSYRTTAGTMDPRRSTAAFVRQFLVSSRSTDDFELQLQHYRHQQQQQQRQQQRHPQPQRPRPHKGRRAPVSWLRPHV